jgi:hypothetical protein
MDILEGVYFIFFVVLDRLPPTFVLLIETETGSAGEQPARDQIGDRQKCHSMGCTSCTAH